MKKFRTIFVVSLLMICALSASAQKRGNNVSIRVGGVLPLQEFHATPAYVVPGNALEAAVGKTPLHNTGAASFGATLGVKENYIFDFGMGIFLSADLMWNMINKSVSKVYDQVSCTKPMYINVPIIVGLNYVTDFSDIVDVWAEAGIGADMFYKTQEGWSNALIKYDMSASFAAMGGAGVTFIDLISVGINYYWLGKQSIKVNGVTYDETYVTPNKMKSGVLTFRVGFHF
ncbi:MAG: hypothetical protein J5642_01700 [Bacteroidales bacterium]|nr:hypothetical protein [Bacteroidales bacterium]